MNVSHACYSLRSLNTDGVTSTNDSDEAKKEMRAFIKLPQSAKGKDFIQGGDDDKMREYNGFSESLLSVARRQYTSTGSPLAWEWLVENKMASINDINIGE